MSKRLEAVAAIGSRLGDTSDLPPQLRALLVKKPTLIGQVLDALRALDGIATTDELLVMVWRQTGRVCPRRAFEVTLYAAAARGAIGRRRLRPGVRTRRSKTPAKAWVLHKDAIRGTEAASRGET